MEKFTPLAKILHCRRHWRHWQIPPLTWPGSSILYLSLFCCPYTHNYNCLLIACCYCPLSLTGELFDCLLFVDSVWEVYNLSTDLIDGIVTSKRHSFLGDTLMSGTFSCKFSWAEVLLKESGNIFIISQGLLKQVLCFVLSSCQSVSLGSKRSIYPSNWSQFNDHRTVSPDHEICLVWSISLLLQRTRKIGLTKLMCQYIFKSSDKAQTYRCHFHTKTLSIDVHCTEEHLDLTPAPPWARNLVARPLPLVPHTRGHTYRPPEVQTWLLAPSRWCRGHQKL